MKNNVSSIKVAGLDIPLNVVASFPDGRLGEYDGNKREISLSQECLSNMKLFQATLIHEVVHCALDLSGANYGTGGYSGGSTGCPCCETHRRRF